MNSQQVVQLSHRLRTAFRLLTSRFNEIGNKIGNYEMPERLKGSFLERWGKLQIIYIYIYITIMSITVQLQHSFTYLQ